MDKFKHPFKPFINKNSKILILGTFPSIKSFENNFYYAHPKNQFWRLVCKVWNEKLPYNVKEKEQLLIKHNIALWDMIKECKRKNSSDSNLKDIKLNDIKNLLHNYPNIIKICFTSKIALKLYKKNFQDITLPIFYLPSPSPAYASMSFNDKLQEYKKILMI
jgi:hypoxanthine-DNA glycosylase